MHFPVIVAISGAADAVDAYRQVVAAMEPYTWDFLANEQRPLARCDGWVLGGGASGLITLEVPHAALSVAPWPNASERSRALVLRDPAAPRWPKPYVSKMVDPSLVVDLAPLALVDREKLQAAVAADVPAIVGLGGWIDLDEDDWVTDEDHEAAEAAQNYLAALPDAAWLAVLDARF